MWAFEPVTGSVHCAAWVSPEEYAFITGRGFARIDGQPARPVLPDCDQALGFLRLRFDEPYEKLERQLRAA